MELEIDRSIVEKIFTSSVFFEKEILHVASNSDRSDIMNILRVKLVRDILKEHINFLYIRDLSDFTLKPIVNILFKEIANEWIHYAMDTLDYSKDEALLELQPKDRVRLIHTLAASYYREYKSYIFEEIADTFIELIASISHSSDKSILVNAVINSELIANRNVLGINNFDQLYKKARSAKNLKTSEVSTVQMKISDILKDLNNPKISDTDREKLLIVLPKYEKKEKQIIAKNLEHFDASLQRVKTTIINSLSREIFNN